MLHARGIASLTIGLIPNIAIVRLVGENLPDVACTIKVADLLPGNEFAELLCLLLGGETESLASKASRPDSSHLCSHMTSPHPAYWEGVRGST